MLQNLKKYASAVLAGAGLVAGSAMAQTTPSIDVSSVTTVIGEVVTAAATIGAAALAMFIGIRAYKWLRGAA